MKAQISPTQTTRPAQQCWIWLGRLSRLSGSRAAVVRRSEQTRILSASDHELGGSLSAIRSERSEPSILGLADSLRLVVDRQRHLLELVSVLLAVM